MNVTVRSQNIQQQLWKRLVTHFHIDSTACTPIHPVDSSCSPLDVYKVHYNNQDYYVDHHHNIYTLTHLLPNGGIGIVLKNEA